MKNLKTPLRRTNVSMHFRNYEQLLKTPVPDLLVSCDSEYKAIASNSILYFSKNGNNVSIYCNNRRSYKIKLSIPQLWKKIESWKLFRRVSENLIVNTSQIVSINRNGNKLIHLKNGDEVTLEENLFTKLMDSVLVV